MTSLPESQPISDHETLMRRVRPDQVTTRRDGNGKRPASHAFIQGDPDGNVSVYLASETTPERITASYPGIFVAEVTAATIRGLGLEVEREPIDGDPGHGNITGLKTRAIATAIANSTRWAEGYGPD